MKVFYSTKMVADQGEQGFAPGVIKSPSSRKPEELALLLNRYPWIEFVEPNPVTLDDFKLVHDRYYVEDIMDLAELNGFGNRSQAIADTLPYTTGAMCDAALAATHDQPTCALVAGFHHAGFMGWQKLGYFCTFNGLMVAAAKMILQHKKRHVTIIDCDMHWGNGTDNILNYVKELKPHITHISFGQYFGNPDDATQYLSWFDPDGIVEKSLMLERPDLILYQAGADVHVDDPYGGVLTTEQIRFRDKRMFELAKMMGIPLAWNLAGGYQVEEDGSIQKVLDIHLNTFEAYREVYLCDQEEWETSAFKPDWYSPPGETIECCLNERNRSVEWFSEQLGRSVEFTESFMKGEEVLTPEIANKLVNLFGSTQKFWLRREKIYRQDKSRIEE